MKHFSIIILVLGLNASAQNNRTYLIYDPATKTVRFSDKQNEVQNMSNLYGINSGHLTAASSLSYITSSSVELTGYSQLPNWSSFCSLSLTQLNGLKSDDSVLMNLITKLPESMSVNNLSNIITFGKFYDELKSQTVFQQTGSESVIGQSVHFYLNPSTCQNIISNQPDNIIDGLSNDGNAIAGWNSSSLFHPESNQYIVVSSGGTLLPAITYLATNSWTSKSNINLSDFLKESFTNSVQQAFDKETEEAKNLLINWSQNITRSNVNSRSVLYSNHDEFKDVFPNKNPTAQDYFQFKDVLLSKDGDKFSLSETYSTGTINSSSSAQWGNGSIVNQNAVFQTSWNGSDLKTYAKLSAPTESQPVSFILNPSANVSNDNQQGYFGIKLIGENNFGFGTLTTNNAWVGFGDQNGTTLSIRAATIQTNAALWQNGTFKTTELEVTDNDMTGIPITSKTLAFFSSANAKGTNIEIQNTNSSSSDAFARATFNQNGISNLITTYPSNANAFKFPGTFAFESWSPNGMSFDVHNASGSVQISIADRQIITVRATSISIGTILQLDGLTTEEILAIPNPQPGANVYNQSTDEQWIYRKKEGWTVVTTKRVNVPKHVTEKNL